MKDFLGSCILFGSRLFVNGVEYGMIEKVCGEKNPYGDYILVLNNQQRGYIRKWDCGSDKNGSFIKLLIEQPDFPIKPVDVEIVTEFSPKQMNS